MSARLAVAAVCAGILALGRAAPARADADSILVRVGGNLAGRAGETIDVPVTVDLSGAPGRSLGSYTATLTFNPAQLQFGGAGSGDFAAPQTNTAHASDSGTVRLTAVQPSGASGLVVLFYARFYVLSDSGQSPVTISFSEMSATATSTTPFESLLPLLRTLNGTFCKSLGRWGDVDGDGQANSFDALVALSVVVGIPVDTTELSPELADVDGDGRITSRDALIILSYSVGLPVTGYRILLDAPGACGTGSPITIVITPDSLELQVGQTTPVVFAALDSLGHSVTTDTGTVTSSDPSIAAWVEGEGGGLVQARAPGTAILTARLGPGVAATFKVVVVARRIKWWVDVLRARLAPVQLGDSVLPFEYIGDAVSLAHNGDTVLVAGGTYEELVSSYGYEASGQGALTIIGDPVNRPVIDPRGSGEWYQSAEALDLEPGIGQLALLNLVVRAGTVYLAGHDVTVRNVRIEGLGTNAEYGLVVTTVPSGGDAPPARAAGPERSPVPEAPGNALVDGVTVLGDSLYNGIMVRVADTATIRNSSVRRSQSGQDPTCGAEPYTYGGILVQQASVSVAQSDTVINPECQGIALFDADDYALLTDLSRTVATHNVVSGAPGTGIALGARLDSSDHNQVGNTGLVLNMRSFGQAVGIYAMYYDVAPDTVWSLGDVITGSGGRGFAIDTAAKGVIDGLVVAGSGLDSSDGGHGVDLGPGGTYWLSRSRVTNVVYAEGVRFSGDHTSLHSHGNYIADVWDDGLTAYQNGECEGDCSPPARAAAARPQRAGPYRSGPDTLTSVSDTILDVGGTGLYMSDGVYVLVDSLLADSAGGDNIQVWYVGKLLVQHARVSRAAQVGIDAYSVDTVGIRFSSVTQFGVDGIAADYGVDSARVYGDTVANGLQGIVSISGGSNMLVDSSLITNDSTGFIFDGGAGARIQRSRIDGNGFGVMLACCYYDSVVVRQSTIQNSWHAGADNFNTEHGAILDADSNYWGNETGPACRQYPPTTVCGNAGAGDSIQTVGVTYDGFLASPPVTPAPPVRPAALAGAPMGRGGAPVTVAASGPGVPPRVVELAGAGAHPARRSTKSVPAHAPVASRAARLAADRAAAARRPPHRAPAAWHAPTKARAHAVQILLRKRR